MQQKIFYNLYLTISLFSITRDGQQSTKKLGKSC